MLNIKFNYRYRDSGNYKNYGYVILANPDNLELSEIENLIRAKLTDETWFYADQFGITGVVF